MIRVLVIDDDRLQVRLLRAHFKNFRRGTYSLDWSETYEDGLARLLTGDYSACLLDFRLGDRDGLQLIREATVRGCRTPIVFLTGMNTFQNRAQGTLSGGNDFIGKPFNLSELCVKALTLTLKSQLKIV